MVDKEKIMSFVRSKGPILPVQLCKELGESTFIVGALLSELVKSGRVMVSTVKVGGSPLYYVDEQRHKLQNYSDYLSEKDKEAYEILKEKVVVRDKGLTPLLRVSMRKINDFAFPVRVSLNGSEELFWRWYLTPVSEVEKILHTKFNSNSKEDEKAQKEQPKERVKDNFEEEKQKIETSKDFNKHATGDNKSQENESEKREKKEKLEKGNFQKLVESFLEEKGVQIKSIKQTKKNKEFDYTLKVPSAIGEIEFFCRAKEKKRINENDIANAFFAGQNSKRPVFFITTGELSKSAKESLPKDFPGLVFHSFQSK